MTHTTAVQAASDLWDSFWSLCIAFFAIICAMWIGVALEEARNHNLCRKCKGDMGIYK